MDTLAITHTLIPDCLVLPRSLMTELQNVEEKRNYRGENVTFGNKEQDLSRQTQSCWDGVSKNPIA